MHRFKDSETVSTLAILIDGKIGNELIYSTIDRLPFAKIEVFTEGSQTDLRETLSSWPHRLADRFHLEPIVQNLPPLKPLQTCGDSLEDTQSPGVSWHNPE